MKTTLPVAEALTALLQYVSSQPGEYELSARHGDSLYAYKTGEEVQLWVRGESAEVYLSGNKAYGNTSSLSADAKWEIVPNPNTEEDNGY